MTHIAIFASGAGSNAQKIIDYFRGHDQAGVVLIVSNVPNAGVVDIAHHEQIPLLIVEKKKFFEGDAYLPELRSAHIDFIVLAGFLWKVPDAIIRAYPYKIVNIHPALLPSYGGKGMFGMNVHRAVLQAGEKDSGITIHYVDEHYDNGDIIFQEKCSITNDDTPETVAAKVHALEHRHYPRVIEQLIQLQKQR